MTEKSVFLFANENQSSSSVEIWKYGLVKHEWQYYEKAWIHSVQFISLFHTINNIYIVLFHVKIKKGKTIDCIIWPYELRLILVYGVQSSRSFLVGHRHLYHAVENTKYSQSECGKAVLYLSVSVFHRTFQSISAIQLYHTQPSHRALYFLCHGIKYLCNGLPWLSGITVEYIIA